MAISDFRDFLYPVWYKDSTGNKISVQRTNETYEIIKNKVLLKEIPDEFYKVNITNYYEIKQGNIPSDNEYYVDYYTGEIVFNESQNAKTITVSSYYARGIIYIFAERIITDFDSQNNNIKETFKTLIDNLNHKGVYSSSTTYYPRNIVSYAGGSYMCIQQCTNIPPSNTLYWQQLTNPGLELVFRNEYDNGLTYDAKDLVSYDGSLYYCLQPSTGNLPTDNAYWSVFLVAKTAGVMLKNTKTITSATSNITIDIVGFNYLNDYLMVFTNTTYIEKDQDYTINVNGVSIDKISGTWSTDGTATTFNFIVFKNVIQTINFNDGSLIQDRSVVNTKLALNSITNDELSSSNKNYSYNAKGYDTLQHTVDAAKNGGSGIVYLPPGTFTAPIVMDIAYGNYSNITIMGSGPGATVIDMTGMGSTLASQQAAITVSGSTGGKITLAADAAEGDASVTVSSSSGLSVGDWVQLGSDGFIAYHADYKANKGEIKRIRTIVGNVLTFEDNLFDAYVTADNAFVRKVNFVNNITIRDLTIKGTDSTNGESGIRFTYCYNPRVENVHFEYMDIYQCLFDSCLYPKAFGNHFQGTYYDQLTGINFYAVCVLNSTQWPNIFGNTSVECRHLFVSTAHSYGQDKYGQPLFINVEGNTAHHCNGSYAYEHHGFGRFINIIGNTANNCFAGVNIEGSDVIVANNQFYDCSNYGVVIGDGPNIKNITVENNNIVRCLGGVYVYGTVDYQIDKVKILNNTITTSSTGNGVYTTSYVTNIEIVDNQIYGIGGSFGYGVNNYSVGADISGNRINNFAGAIYNLASDCIIKRNKIDTTTLTHGIYNNGGADCIITENRLKNIKSTAYAIALANTSTYNIVSLNNYRGNTNGLSQGTGTGHVVANNVA